MSNTSTQDYTWPPVYDVLELTNCDELAHIWNWYQQPGGLQQASLSDEVIQYIYHGLTGYLENSSQKGLSQPPHNEVLEWIRTSAVENYVTMLAIGDPYYKNNDGQYIGEMKFMPECWLEVCRVLPWDGNPDIAGVGMLATYTLQTCLVTVYLFALIIIRFDWTPIKMRNFSPIKQTLLAIQHSIGSFLSASFVFCIAMLLASLLSSVDNASNSSSTTWALLIIMPVSSILPVVVLHLAAPDTLRRAKGRMLLWLLVFTLTLTLLARTMLVILGPEGETSTRFEFSYSSWEARCLDFDYISPVIIFSWTIAAVLCLSIGIYIIRSAVASLRRHGTRKQFHLPQILWWGMTISAFGAMWTFIGWFIYFTFLLRDRARNNNKDKEWSFGQVLALATWVPFLVEFAYMWWEEPEDALNGRLMDPYEVVRVSERTRSIELEQTGGDEATARLLHRTTV